MAAVTVTIATRNRREDLAKTCAALRLLNPAPLEVLVCADGCTDGTAEMLAADFPEFGGIENERPRGSIASRDALIRQARGDVVLSLDDDSYPIESDAIRQIAQLFETAPRLAVAAFPQRSDEFPDSISRLEFGPEHACGSFANSGAAIRRAAYLELGGYPAFFFHAYEEPDFALRCVDAGWEVRFTPAVTIRHHYSGTERNELRTHHFHSRNELWSVLMRCPFPWLPVVVAFRVARQFGYAWSRGWRWVLAEPRWWVAALAGVPRCIVNRRPIPWRAYRAWMDLIRTAPR
jgi:GT2 family glycosyltransferase